MIAVELMEYVGGMANYLKVLTEWSMIRVNAHRSKLGSKAKNKRFMSMTLEEYIMTESAYKPKKKYKPRANTAFTQVERNKLNYMKKLSFSGYYTMEDALYIQQNNSRAVVNSDIWNKTNSRGKYL